MSKQEKAFDKAVQQSVEVMYNHHKENMLNGDPVDYLNNIIQHVDEQLNMNRLKKELAIVGYRSYKGFTDGLCDKILSTQKPTKWDIVWREKTDKGWKEVENPIYGFIVYYKLKKKLEQLMGSAKNISMIREFIRYHFTPTKYSSELVEEYLICKELNPGYSRPKVLKEISTKYPDSEEINTASQTLPNWEQGWKDFRDTRTDNT